MVVVVIILTTSDTSTIGGGSNNYASADTSTIGGGANNCASGIKSTVGGGQSNTASGCFATVGGGSGNCASYNYATVGGGNTNTASGNMSTVGGGRNNIASGSYSSILGGRYNTASGYCSSVLGGRSNDTCGFANSHIIGSRINASSADTTFVQNLSKTSGTFRISHPDPSKTETHYLQHSFVESPNAGDNIYRYEVLVKNGIAEIQLPDYFKFLNENPQVWVSAKNDFGIAYGFVNKELTKVTISANLDIEYNVLIIGTRKDKDAVKNWNGIEILKKNKKTSN